MAKKSKKSFKKRPTSKRKTTSNTAGRVSVTEVLRWLKGRGSKKQVKELDRYGITATEPFGVAMGELKKYAKEVGTDHELAHELWATGRYEAQLLASMVADPAKVTAAQMNAWAADFDNWAIVDTVCFHLFDRTKHAWKKVSQWAKAKPEFTKRTAFALLWSLTVHDKNAPDKAFTQCLPLVEEAAADERHFVKKAVNMALRAVGKRNKALNAAAIKTAQRLAKSEEPAPRWVGTHALRELKSPAVRKRLSSART